MPNPTVVTLSSVGTSTPANLDWRSNAGYVTAVVSLGSTTMTTDFTLQYTLDDSQLSTTRAWFGVSSAIGSSITHFSSANADAGVTFTFLTPLAGLRISSTAISSSSLTLRVLQAGP